MSLLDMIKFERVKKRTRQPEEIPMLAYLRTDKTVRIVIGADVASRIDIKHLTGVEVLYAEKPAMLCISINELEPMLHAREIYNGNAFELKSARLQNIPESVLPYSSELKEMIIDEIESIHFIAHVEVKTAPSKAAAQQPTPYTGKKRGRPKKVTTEDTQP